ncbi:MAG: hypothetical protein MUC87_10630 [Bacteroidia bacterium]|jgi:hypothetical protein|nr:hypothetical protein [Bacteroidia bacterium]
MKLFLHALLLMLSASASAQIIPDRELERVPRMANDTMWCMGMHYPKGQLYFGFGYNKEWYTRSNIHVKDESGDYDFVLHGMTAKDRPKFNEVLRVALSIPQYGYRIGYWLPSSRFGIELNFDHAKYVIDEYQTVRLTGRIEDKVYDVDTLVSPVSFFAMEHTDGANFLMLNLMFRRPLVQKKYVHVYGVAKAGAGIVVPRTDVTLFGQRWNHNFHVAGQIGGIETGLRVEILRYFWIEPTVKGVFANFNKVLAIDDVLISHRFGAFMLLAHAGFQFPVGKVHRGKLPR